MKRKLSTEVSPSKKKIIKVTPQQISNYTYSRHGLIKRFTWDSLPEHVFPLHATSNLTPYLQILARVENFDWKEFSKKLHSNPVELTLQRCMRGTLHVFPVKMNNIVMSIYGLEDDEPDLNTNHKKSKSLFSKEDIEILVKPILNILLEMGPQTQPSIKKLLNKKIIKEKKEQNRKENNVTATMRYLWYTGKIEYGCTNIDNVKSWKEPNRKYRYGTLKIDRMNIDDGMTELARWYFDTYGPASINDFIWWTGLAATKCKNSFKKIIENYHEIKVEGIDHDLYIHKDQVDILLQTETDVLKMERFLPYEDSIVKGYKETRWRFFNKEEESKVMRRGELMPSVWIDGRPVGLLNSEKKATSIEITLWENKEEYKKRLEKEVEIMKNFGDFKNILWK